MENNIGVDKNKRLKKWFKIIVLIALLIFVLGLVFNKFFWLSITANFRNKMLTRYIAREEQRYKNDKYGGKTPEETYAMFLEALKKKDIELASKYFTLDKQEQYKKALQGVDKNGQWSLMMDDLTQKNIKGRYIGKTLYAMEFYDDDNNFLMQIDFSLPIKTFQQSVPISDIWKISTF